MSGSFSDSLIKNQERTFGEIRRRAVSHIAAEEAVSVKRSSMHRTPEVHQGGNDSGGAGL